MAQFCILAGVHRLQSVTPKPGQHFFGQGNAVLSGARVLDQFVRQGDAWAATVEIPASAEHGACIAARRACSRPAGLFIDGRALEQSDQPTGLRADQFFVDRAERKLLFAADPAGKTVEWSVTRQAFAGPARDVAIEGLVIEKYANAAQEGAVWPGGTGWRISRVEARMNNGVGLVAGTDGAILDCDVHHNGQLGIGAGGAARVLISGNRVWANNVNGFDAEWEAGGIKVAESRQVVLRGNEVHHNDGPGIWCDENCRDVLIERNAVRQNSAAGIFYEISSDAVIRGNTLSENGQAAPGWVWGAEIQVAASRNVTVAGNVLTVRRDGRAIMLIDQNRRMATGGYYGTRGNMVQGNRMTFLGGGLSGGASDAGPGAVNFGIIQSGGNRFDRNTYRLPEGGKPGFIWGQQVIDLQEFRRQGQETHGVLQTAAPAPAARDTAATR